MEDISPEYGESLAEWQTLARPYYKRGVIWYAIAAVVGVVLLAYSFWTANFLFAVLVVMFGIIITLQASRAPEVLDVAVTSVGVLLGARFIPFKDLKSFWIVYDPPGVKNLYLDFKRALFPHEVVMLEDVDPVELREILMQYLIEDGSHDGEPGLDTFSRIFKI
jgi:hypothetical protein